MGLRQVKQQIRILGVDDARFDRKRDEWTRIVGVVHRGGEWIEGCLQIPIQIDGDDVTDQLARMVKSSTHYGQLRVIMTRDTIFGGVNVLSLPSLYEKTGLPVIAVSDSKPNMNRVKEAFQRISPASWKQKFRLLKDSGPIREVESRASKAPVYLQWAGLSFKQVVELIQKSATRSRIPEPLRVAHLIASSFVPNP
ncbi:MAG: DUF99 family protein [Candidatus Thorarchaeota archaeon]